MQRTLLMTPLVPFSVKKFIKLEAFHKINKSSYSTKDNIREYFYHIDVHGQLYLEDTKPKNFTTCFKDKRFLDFFFQRLRTNNTGRNDKYPYISPCGKEWNFIASEDAPIVFTDFAADGERVVIFIELFFIFLYRIFKVQVKLIFATL
ncbi:hypothetical protein K7432_013377 [Basidiobolus ranarum]|uniref:Uncharacterized protein n=1 Tax=Basidiobolus ranarum TaxID=34480 RepID=A0ABR2WJC7_9FUNG